MQYACVNMQKLDTFVTGEKLAHNEQNNILNPPIE